MGAYLHYVLVYLRIVLVAVRGNYDICGINQ